MRQRHQLMLRYRDELERADDRALESEEVERATEKWDAAVVARLGETDARILGDVVAALRRLEGGTYGSCLTCGEAISEARLDALPTASLCIECAEEARPVTFDRYPAQPARRV